MIKIAILTKENYYDVWNKAVKSINIDLKNVTIKVLKYKDLNMLKDGLLKVLPQVLITPAFEFASMETAEIRKYILLEKEIPIITFIESLPLDHILKISDKKFLINIVNLNQDLRSDVIPFLCDLEKLLEHKRIRYLRILYRINEKGVLALIEKSNDKSIILSSIIISFILPPNIHRRIFKLLFELLNKEGIIEKGEIPSSIPKAESTEEDITEMIAHILENYDKNTSLIQKLKRLYDLLITDTTTDEEYKRMISDLVKGIEKYRKPPRKLIQILKDPKEFKIFLEKLCNKYKDKTWAKIIMLG